MAKELVNPSGGPNSQYHILLAKIKLAKNQLEEAEKHITESLSFDYQVIKFFEKKRFENIFKFLNI